MRLRTGRWLRFTVLPGLLALHSADCIAPQGWLVMSADPENTRRPRVTSARRLDSLQRALAELLATWDASTNPAMWSASGQLKKAMAEAEHDAYSAQTDWMQRQYEAGLSR